MKSKSVQAAILPNLESLRFLAFLVVFINHIVACLGHKTNNTMVNTIKTDYLLNGDLGVNFFFVLSGFLITYLLLEEKKRNDKINIPNFYFRRVLRIWPLYFLVLIIGLGIIPKWMNDLPNGFPILTDTSVLNKQWYVFFLGNFDYVKNGISNAIVGILWSVSIEEQFYLIWPLLLSVIPMKHLTKVLILLILCSTAYRLFGSSGRTLNLMLKYHTFSCLSDLCIGALFANAAFKTDYHVFKNMNRYLIFFFYAIGITLLIFRTSIYKLEISYQPQHPTHYLKAVMPVFYSLFFAFIIVEQVFSKNSLFKIGVIPLLPALGKISYGLYCFHMICMLIVTYTLMKLDFNILVPGKQLILVESVLSLLLTILVAYVSYRYVESPFLSLKERLRKEPTVKNQYRASLK
jgi:peptidoglycan/LPS O-acetylase OafA/YrhL